METPPEEITKSQDSMASDKNDSRCSLSSLSTSFIKTEPPIFSTKSENTYRLELYISPSLIFLPGSTNSLPVPKIAIFGFFDTFNSPYPNVAQIPISLGFIRVPLLINISPF